ncbi:MAG TPA: hypothetical protein VIJ38_11000, partial [Acidobacteriaceae bacterium]
IGCAGVLTQDSSIIKSTVEPAKLFDGLRNQRLYLFGLRYVGLHEANIQAGLPQLLFNSLSAFGSARGERDACSGLSEELRRSLADSKGYLRDGERRDKPAHCRG